jgi:predicted  nucleic acid-binding Zn-ribbon protein
MKKVFKTKMKSITRVLSLVIIASLATFTGCKSYDEDIDNLKQEITDLKADLTKQITDANAATVTTINASIATLTTDINALKTRVATLESTGATDAEVTAAIAAAKTEILSKTVTLEAFNAYKTSNDAEIAALKTKVAAAATTADLNAYKTEVNNKILEISNTLTNLGATVSTLNGKVGTLTTDVTALQANYTSLLATVNAQKATLDGLVAVLGYNGTSKTSSVIADIQTKLADYLTKINAHTTDITAIKADLVTIKANLTNAATKADVATLQTAVDAAKTDITALKTRMTNLESAVSLNFIALSHRLTSLTFIPTFYINGIEAMNFSPLVSPCYTKSPVVEFSYNVSPSFITAADIDVNNLAFTLTQASNALYLVKGLNAPEATTKVKATFKSLANGVLTVSVDVTDYSALVTTYTSWTENFSSIALQVPLSAAVLKDASTNNVAASGVVTSDYVRLFSQTQYSQYTSLVRKDVTSLPAYPNIGAYVYTVGTTNYTSTVYYPLVNPVLDATKALAVNGVDGATADAPTIVHVPYGATINLIDYVKSIINGADLDLAKYGLKLVFDLNTLNSSNADVAIVYNRGSNNTDQQNFISLTDAAKGTVTAKVFSAAEIAAAQGRTPIVRVRLVSADGSCVLNVGYIKLYLDEKPVPTAITAPTVNLGTSVAGCSSLTAKTTVEFMNTQLYNKVPVGGVSKELFHSVYSTSFAGIANNDGSIYQVLDADASVTTYLLQWDISASTVWSKLASLAAGASYTFTDSVKYVPSDEFKTVYPVINVVFTRTVTKPANLNITSASLISNYWYATSTDVTAPVASYSYTKHNVFVPNLGETNSALAVFENNINQAFQQNSDKSLNIDGSATTTKTANTETNYDYYFYATQPPHNLTASSQITLKVSPDMKALLAAVGSLDTIAYIKPFVSGAGDVMVLNPRSATAKTLLNYSAENLQVRLGMTNVACPDYASQSSRAVTVNGNPYFEVVFVRPVSATEQSAKSFTDGVNYGEAGSYISVDSLVSLKDWRNYTFVQYPWFNQYYGITSITVNTGAIKTDIGGLSTPVAISNYPELQITSAASPFYGNTSTSGFLTYRNTGSVLGVQFNLYVPVTITYKWGTINSTVITVPVKKTVGPSGVKKK